MPIQDEKEYVAVRDWIYREEKNMHNEDFTPSPNAYGRGYVFVKKMDYPRHGPLSNRLDARAESLDHQIFGCKSKKSVGLGYVDQSKSVSSILDKSDSEEEQEYIPNSENQQDMCEDWVPSTNLLWGDSDNLVSHETVAKLEQEFVTLDDIEASTSRHPKHSWCKNPSQDSVKNSNEYEWDSLLEPSTVDMDIDFVYTYSSQPDLVNDSCLGSDDLNSHVSLVDDSLLVRMNPNLGSLGSYLIDSNSSFTRDIIHIHILEPVIDLPLVHLDLIYWSLCNQELDLLTFQNDYEIA